MLWLFSWATWLLLTFFVVSIFIILSDKKSKGNTKLAPGPKKWPLIGNIPYMAKFVDGTAAFTALAQEYGDIVTVKLGTVDCLLLTGLEKLRHVLITKAHIFDARPNFMRYNLLFGGDKNNSIAFADWSDLQRKRRDLMANHTFPRQSTSFFESLDSIATDNVLEYMETLKVEVNNNKTLYLKPQLSKMLGKIFFKYFCSQDVDFNDDSFVKMVDSFDLIFQEINEGCVGDLIPFLMKFMNKSYLTEASENIREYVIRKCVEPRLASREALKQSKLDENNNSNNDPAEPSNDLLDTFLNNLGCSEGLTMETALFALEDILGGHSAISNSFMRILHLVTQNPEVQQNIRKEVLNNSSGFVTLENRLPYTEATIWEAIRHISSPIVPHVATEDTQIDDFSVKKGTVIFLNNYELHFSDKHWSDPQKFMPERFIGEGGRIVKPEHFFPFSMGRRSCMGYKLVLNLSSILLANLCQNFQIELDPTEDYSVARCMLAVPGKGKRFIFSPID